MRRHIAYLKYIIRHKWFVFIACRKLKVSLWRAIIHDWTKFLPSEWGLYARTFYKPDGTNQYVESAEFARAWRHHQRRNLHHWQAWLLTWDSGKTQPLYMPSKYTKEMVADWYGAGRAITGKWGARDWYLKNKEKIKLHEATKVLVELLLGMPLLEPAPHCAGCGNMVDSFTCHCGDYIDKHGIGSGHSPVPMGCTCGYAKED